MIKSNDRDVICRLNLAEVHPPSDSVSSLCFSPKANFIVATSWDNQLRTLCNSLSFIWLLQLWMLSAS
ncbi:hypothetical protein Nepgr_004813 [Nepenthes gracilis]|uniref:Uncharacterized protein n=1 Tax=Nepenthes gracilis TaxID=150966 RepID=A0AAD3S268_NEPGR|nr:hypothetical protein Nepgr_004813 [Nepenthes gracilis]